jgi:hypothetical protein
VLGKVSCSWLVWAIIVSFVLLVLVLVFDLNKIFLKESNLIHHHLWNYKTTKLTIKYYDVYMVYY